MFANLKNHPEIRRSLGIAAGVFAGLLAYRALLSALGWWNGLWDYQREPFLLATVLAGVACAAIYIFRSMRRALNRRADVDSLSRIRRGAESLRALEQSKPR